ncbi:hypothetical protein QTP88_004004 [Uroleucon formosanum]
MQLPQNGPCQGPLTRDVGPQLRILQLNIEGISRKTHAENASDLSSRGHIDGFTLASATYHKKYGSATYVRNNISNWEHISTSDVNNVSLIKIKIEEINIINVYKPPGANWSNPTLPSVQHPTVIIGDFNSHHHHWGYDNNDLNGESILEWMDREDVSLLFDAKDKGTFRSGRWQKDYNPDLCFVTRDELRRPLYANRKVLNDFPRSQHRPVIANIGIQIPITKSIQKPRWNFQKANWEEYRKRLDDNIRWIKPESINYGRFVGMVISTAKKCFPRGYRKDYIPGWSKESDDLYTEYKATYCHLTAEELLNSLTKARKDKWIKTVENMDFKRSSQKAWKLIRRIDPNTNWNNLNIDIQPENFVNRIIDLSRAAMDKESKRKTLYESRVRKSTLEVR